MTHHYAPENNAPQRRWSALVPRLVADGVEVTVIAPPPHYPAGHRDDLTSEHAPGTVTSGEHGETVYRVRFREHGQGLRSRSIDQAVAALDSAWLGLRLFRSRASRPDVIVSTAPGLPSIAAGWLLGLLLHVPHVIEMRDAWPDLIHASGMLRNGQTRVSTKRRVLTLVADRVLTWLQRSAAVVVTTTDSFAEVLRSRRVQQVEVIRNGAPLDKLEPLAPPAPTSDALHIAYVGTMGRSQGLDVAIRAAASASALGIPVELRFVGGGADEDELQTLAQTLGAPVTFVGRVPVGDIVDHYRWADTVLVSLRDWAPFEWTVPSKTYEALALQRHVSAVVAGETAGLITSVHAGDVVSPGDDAALALLWGRLARHREQLAVGPAGREWAMDHANFDELALSYLRLLKSVAA
ncbi:glycosyltransferase family 4 protein [Sanguibacter antarcticus]|uniref:D-inositol 3-phosphate glycosyltransferase n=1 Tax=Sanguibacter antarcticus TaxID=372484 RepID=A0A2A9DZQ1_9MICO|nr:glycosyltransferase family 4 protein [Sanguibacter antarcticus]PFG32277.1 glycosyltransferase involved in cell wall biosynthesis [Sanguibacter antarcticus]